MILWVFIWLERIVHQILKSILFLKPGLLFYFKSNRIENNNGPGIKIGIANKAKVKGILIILWLILVKIVKNTIKLNQDGIYVTSADPHIFKNKIEKNYQNAIFICTHDDIRCDGLVEKNEISANKRNGIHVTGFNNYPRILGNTFIQYNKLAGIRVDNSAHCSILRNAVSKNLGQVNIVSFPYLKSLGNSCSRNCKCSY